MGHFDMSQFYEEFKDLKKKYLEKGDTEGYIEMLEKAVMALHEKYSEI